METKASTQGSPVKCPKCGRTCKSQMGLLIHLSRKHPDAMEPKTAPAAKSLVPRPEWRKDAATVSFTIGRADLGDAVETVSKLPTSKITIE